MDQNAKKTKAPVLKILVTCLSMFYFGFFVIVELPSLAQLFVIPWTVEKPSIEGSIEDYRGPTRLLCPWDFQTRILDWVASSFSIDLIVFI